MPTALKTLLLLAIFVLPLSLMRPEAAATGAGPQFTRDGQLLFPTHYREWIYLSSGFDMSYRASMQMGDAHMFDNVFAEPNAYARFLRTGTWPDKTMLVLEVRNARGKGSINQQGSFQTDLLGVEVHVEDASRFSGKWAFFAFGAGEKTTAMIPHAASCYACHSAHGVVDTTFVQFYPTLLPIATAKRTFRRGNERDFRGRPR